MANMPITANARPTERELLAAAASQLRRALPSTWKLDWSRREQSRDAGIDAVATIKALDGTTGIVAFEVKRAPLMPSTAAAVAKQTKSRYPKADAYVLVAPFIGPVTREALRREGWGVLDATGNLELRLDRPAVLLQRTGETKNPWPVGRVRRSLKAPRAARVVRALADYRPPYGVRELARRARVSAGYAAELLALLEGEGVVTRDVLRRTAATPGTEPQRLGGVADVDWARLIRRWTEDYSTLRSNRYQSFLQPRGIPALLSSLKRAKQRYALTGAASAQTLRAVAPVQVAICFTPSPPELARELGLSQSDGGENVILVEPFDEVVFERSRISNGNAYTAASQTLADLITSPGRGSAEAEALEEWMRRNQREWRS
jgi:IclR-like helix-turn-helix domain-containing protein